MVSKNDYNILQTIVDVTLFIAISIALIVQNIIKACLPSSYRTLKNLKGKNVLITGGGGGLGRLLALKLSKCGCNIILWDVNNDGIQETVKQVKEQGGTVHGFICDLVKNEDVYRVAELTMKQVGDVDILINNAGVLSGGYLLDTPDHLIRRTFEVNAMAHFWTVKAFLPKMMEKNEGHIVTIASMAGWVGISKLVDYCSSKFAAVGFNESLRVELENQGIMGVKTTAICPYFLQNTGMFGNVHAKYLRALKLSDVAERIVEAIKKEEEMVLLPSSLIILLVLKILVPWQCVSMALNGIVPDAAPASQISASNGITNKQTNNNVKNPIKNDVAVKSD